MTPRAVLSALFLVGLLFFFSFDKTSGKSPDAIAMRVVSNPDHYSAQRWYDKKIKLKGSPQLLSVDGYPAVRDGRTVYVSAGNVDLASIVLYTNIYIISYNQEAEQVTQDIFGQILNNWRFNTNLDTAAGVCSGLATKSCLTDKECESFGYCDSFKAQVARDVVRMTRLVDLKATIESYKAAGGKYPTLPAGSYLPNKSISVWPSWQEALAKTILATPPIDPINKIGPCGAAYDPITCWDQVNKTFAWAADLNAGVIPPDNYVFTYSAPSNGSSYRLCGYSESGLMDPALRCSACLPSICSINTCGPDGCSGSCPPGCTLPDVCSAGSCVTSCAATPGCLPAAIANSSPTFGICGGLNQCYACDSGYTWNTAICSPNCTATPGCRLTGSISNATPSSDYCLVGQSCYTCNVGYVWDGSDCVLPGAPCVAAPGCQATAPAFASLVAGTCAGSLQCYACISGYTWVGTQCLADCATPVGCQTTAPANATTTAEYCATGACYQCLTGYTWNGTACLSVSPPCVDNDGDGYDNCSIGATGDDGLQLDCNDANSNIRPGAAEICNGLDDNCSGSADEGCDVDNDNYCSCSQIFEYGSNLTAVCSGTNSTDAASIAATCDCADSNLAVRPGATEVCNNTIDDNCNALIDCSDIAACSAFPGCTLCTDADNDDFSAAGGGSCCGPANDQPCPAALDCNDTNPAVNPGAPEDTNALCNDASDNDCDGQANCADTDCSAASVCAAPCTDADNDDFSAAGGGSCCGPANDQPCPAAPDCDDLNLNINPGEIEVCDNLDNNCQNGIDEACDDDTDDYCDGTMYVFAATVSACPNTSVPIGTLGDDCNDINPAVNPGATEVCNNTIDDNCNTLIDCSDIAACSAFPGCTLCTDADNDDFSAAGGGSCCGPANDQPCPAALDCNDTDPAVNPGALVCSIGANNNCNATPDCGETGCTGAPGCTPSCTFPITFPCTF